MEVATSDMKYKAEFAPKMAIGIKIVMKEFDPVKSYYQPIIFVGKIPNGAFAYGIQKL